MRIIALLLTVVMGLTGCTETASGPRMGPDGKPLPKVYRVPGESRVQYEMLDAVNSLRQAAGQGPVSLDPRLNAAAATHSRDMARQNRPWHFGSDGSSPIDRVRRVGYTGRLVGENISETYETELETLAAWMENEDTRRIILAPGATDLGFAWEQEPGGKIWWTLVMGRSGTGANPNS